MNKENIMKKMEFYVGFEIWSYSTTDSFRTVLKRQDFTLYVMMTELLSIRQRRPSVPRAHNTFRTKTEVLILVSFKIREKINVLIKEYIIMYQA